MSVAVAIVRRHRAAPRAAGRAARSSCCARASCVRVERDSLGQPATLTEGTFLLAIAATGRVTLPAVVAIAGAATVRSTPHVGATSGRPPPRRRASYVRARLDAGAGAAHRHACTSASRWTTSWTCSSTRRRATGCAATRRSIPPEMPAVLAYDLAPPPPVIRAGSRCFETLSYRRALFPLFAGRTAIPAATLTYSLPLSTSFFSREETLRGADRQRALRRASTSAARGAPAEFAGAVGEDLARTSQARRGGGRAWVIRWCSRCGSTAPAT